MCVFVCTQCTISQITNREKANDTDTYRYVTFTAFCYEIYLDKLNNDSLRKLNSSFRLSSHNLEIKTGIYNGMNDQKDYANYVINMYLKRNITFYCVALNIQIFEINI